MGHPNHNKPDKFTSERNYRVSERIPKDLRNNNGNPVVEKHSIGHRGGEAFPDTGINRNISRNQKSHR